MFPLYAISRIASILCVLSCKCKYDLLAFVKLNSKWDNWQFPASYSKISCLLQSVRFLSFIWSTSPHFPAHLLCKGCFCLPFVLDLMEPVSRLSRPDCVAAVLPRPPACRITMLQDFLLVWSWDSTIAPIPGLFAVCTTPLKSVELADPLPAEPLETCVHGYWHLGIMWDSFLCQDGQGCSLQQWQRAQKDKSSACSSLSQAPRHSSLCPLQLKASSLSVIPSGPKSTDPLF